MTTDSTKTSQLELLQNDIRSKMPDAWLFPTLGNVQGFMGAGEVMFVGERPSRGTVNSRPFGVLYRLLEKHAVTDAHLTDIIKVPGKVRDSYPDDIGPDRMFFDRELAIIKPRLVVAFGQRVYWVLQFALAGTGIPVRQTWHYAYLRWPGNCKEFEKQICLALDPSSGYRTPKDAGQAKPRTYAPKSSLH